MKILVNDSSFLSETVAVNLLRVLQWADDVVASSVKGVGEFILAYRKLDEDGEANVNEPYSVALHVELAHGGEDCVFARLKASDAHREQFDELHWGIDRRLTVDGYQVKVAFAGRHLEWENELFEHFLLTAFARLDERVDSSRYQAIEADPVLGTIVNLLESGPYWNCVPVVEDDTDTDSSAHSAYM